jgi:hypothetical protein
MLEHCRVLVLKPSYRVFPSNMLMQDVFNSLMHYSQVTEEIIDHIIHQYWLLTSNRRGHSLMIPKIDFNISAMCICKQATNCRSKYDKRPSLLYLLVQSSCLILNNYPQNFSFVFLWIQTISIMSPQVPILKTISEVGRIFRQNQRYIVVGFLMRTLRVWLGSISWPSSNDKPCLWFRMWQKQINN